MSGSLFDSARKAVAKFTSAKKTGAGKGLLAAFFGGTLGGALVLSGSMGSLGTGGPAPLPPTVVAMIRVAKAVQEALGGMDGAVVVAALPPSGQGEDGGAVVVVATRSDTSGSPPDLGSGSSSGNGSGSGAGTTGPAPGGSSDGMPSGDGAGPPASAGNADRAQIEQLLVEAAQRHGLDEDILKAVAWQESSWRADASSFDGGHGKGVMQIDDRFHEFARTEAVWDPAQNIEYGANFLADLLRETGSYPAALKRYNGGDAYPPKILALAESKPWAGVA